MDISSREKKQNSYIYVLFRRFLKNPAKDVDLRKWAAEGLAYLSLDADVKEDLTSDEDSLRSLIELAKVGCSSHPSSLKHNLWNSGPGSQTISCEQDAIHAERVCGNM